MKSLAVILLILSSVAYGDIISPTRRVDWTGNAGLSNGIPSPRPTYTTLSSGATAAQINAALKACPPGQEVKLLAGTYALSSQIVITQGVTLRGAGPYSTLITGVPRTSGSARGIVNIESPSSTQTRVFKNISSGSTKGSSNIVLSASEPNIKAGYCIFITQTDDNNIVDATHSPGPNSGNSGDLTGITSGTHHSSQLVLVTGVANNSTSFTFTPPLYFDFTNVTGQVWYWQSSHQTHKTNNMVSWAGIEDLAVQNTQASGETPQTIIGVAFASYCWVKNVRTIDAYVSHMEIDRAYRCEIRGNICTNNLAGTSGAGYGILMYYSSSGNLIEDNIIVRNRDFIKVQGGSAGNVIAYNYHTNALPYTVNFTTHSGGTHNAHPLMNLWEGNVTYTPTFDNFWGSASHQTLLRNWCRGPCGPPPDGNTYPTALIINENQWYFNVVGNILGSPAVLSRYSNRKTRQFPPTDSGGYSSIEFGYYDYGPSGSSDATAQWTNTIYAGNYDFVVTNQTWSNGVSSQTISNSYYYTAAPYYFGTSFTWPPFNPETSALRYGETNIPAGWRFRYGTNRTYGILAPVNLRLDLGERYTTNTTQGAYAFYSTNFYLTNIGNADIVTSIPITSAGQRVFLTVFPPGAITIGPGSFKEIGVSFYTTTNDPPGIYTETFVLSGATTITASYRLLQLLPANALPATNVSKANDFALVNGAISASSSRIPFTPGQSGEAYFGFTLTNLSVVNLFASVQATNAVNSFAVEIDGEPVYPKSVWDVPATGAGFVTNYMMFRGLGTASLPTGKQWLLQPGTHYVKIYSQTANTKIASVIVDVRPIIQKVQSAGIGNSGITSQ